MQGRVIVVDGASGAGKSSVIRQLMPMLDNSYRSVAVDDFVTEVFLEHQEQNLSEKEFLARIEQRCDVMHQKIGALVAGGKNVILETVLSGLEGEKSVNLTLAKLKNPPVFMVLIHCPLPLLIERIKQRKQRAKQKHRSEDEHSIVTAISQFAHIYHQKSKPNEVLLEVLSKNDVEAVCNAAEKEFNNDMKSFEQFKSWVFSKLGVMDKEEVAITSQLAYGCIVNTSEFLPRDCARQICEKILN